MGSSTLNNANSITQIVIFHKSMPCTLKITDINFRKQKSKIGIRLKNEGEEVVAEPCPSSEVSWLRLSHVELHPRVGAASSLFVVRPDGQVVGVGRVGLHRLSPQFRVGSRVWCSQLNVKVVLGRRREGRRRSGFLNSNLGILFCS